MQAGHKGSKKPCRWIAATLEQAQDAMPAMPWTRSAKRARRMMTLQQQAI